VKSAERALLVLELLTEQVDGLTFTEICEALNLPKSSAHALLATMCARGFLGVTADDRRYVLGVRTWEIGQAYRAGNTLERSHGPFLRAVRNELNESVQLAVLDGLDNVYVASEEAQQQVVLNAGIGIGLRRPAYATAVGKVLLSGLDDSEVRHRFAGLRLRSYTQGAVTDLGHLLVELAEVRQRGHAVDNGEFTTGVFCVAVPVRDHTGAVCAGMSVSVPAFRVTPEVRKQARAVVGAQADALSAHLGYRTS
jgi:DNA-binding IclR family transcriptional regulator